MQIYKVACCAFDMLVSFCCEKKERERERRREMIKDRVVWTKYALCDILKRKLIEDSSGQYYK